MRGSYAALVARRPWISGVAALVLGVFAAVAVPDVPERLGIGSLALDGNERPASALSVVASSRDASPNTRAGDIALEVISAQLRSDRDVAAVRRTGRGARDTVVLQVVLRGISASDRERAVKRIEGSIDPGPLRVEVTGETVRLSQARNAVADESWRPLVLAVPALALACFLTLGALAGVSAAAAALLAGGLGVGLTSLIGPTLELELLSALVAGPVAVALTVELTVLLAARYREAVALGAGDEAVGLALAEWTPVGVLGPAAAAIASLAALLTPLEQAPSLVFGCALGALAAPVAVGFVVLPVLRSDQVAGESVPRQSVAVRFLVETRLGAVACVVGTALLAGAVVACLGAASAGLAAPPNSGSLPAELPPAGAALAVGTALVAALAARSVRLAVLGLTAAVPAAGGLALASALFGEPASSVPLELGSEGLETAALAVALSVVAAISAARAVMAAATYRDERMLGADPLTAAARAAALVLRASMLSTVALGAASVALVVATDFDLTRQIGVATAAGLVLSLAVALPLGLSLAARLRVRALNFRRPRAPDAEDTLAE